MKRIFLAGMAALAFFAAGCGGGGPEPAGTAVTTITPADGATGVPVTQVITVAFSKDLDETTLTAANITLTRANGAIDVPGTIAYDAAARTLTFTPTHFLLASALHTFTIKAAATTKAAGDFAATFTTLVPPVLYGASTDKDNVPFNLTRVQPDGTGAQGLTNFASTAEGTLFYFLSRSPDYDHIAFTVTVGAGPLTNLYMVRADGSGLMNLTNAGGNYSAWISKWLPGGSRLVFSYRPDSTVDEYALAVVNADGSGLTTISNLPAGVFVTFPFFALSPDGTKVFFTAGDPSTPPWDLYVVNIDGTGAAKLTSVAAAEIAFYPVCSLDGLEVFYAGGHSSVGYGLYAVRPDGSGARTLVAQVSERKRLYPWGFPPDGATLLATFVTESGGVATGDIYGIAMDGAQTRLTTASGTSGGFAATWSPDGSKIAYLYGDPVNGPVNLYVINRDGTGVVPLTSYTGDTMAFDGMLWQMGLGAGKWSPDGTQIAFTRKVESTESNNVMVANADGSGVTALTSTVPPAMAVFADW